MSRERLTDTFPTPLQLRSAELKTNRRGYDREPTDDLLGRLFETYEVLWTKCQALLDDVERLEAEVSEKGKVEHSLQQTLVTAEVAAEKYKEQAREEAGSLLNKARQKAKELVADAEAQLTASEAETKRLAQLEAEARARYESFLLETVASLQAEVERLVPETRKDRNGAPTPEPKLAPTSWAPTPSERELGRT